MQVYVYGGDCTLLESIKLKTQILQIEIVLLAKLCDN